MEKDNESLLQSKSHVGSGCGGALGWLKDINSKGGLVLIHSDWVQMMSESGNIGLCLYILFCRIHVV